MARYLPLLPLLVLLMLPIATGVADDGERGLIAEVKTLRADLEALTKRVAALEQKEGQRAGMVSIVGTFELDRDAWEEDLVRSTLEKARASLDLIEDPEQRARSRANLEEAARAHARKARMTLTLAPDGTFVQTTRFDEDEGDVRGTWERAGDAIVLTATLEDGEPVDPPREMRATLDGGALRLSPPDAEGLTMRLRKR